MKLEPSLSLTSVGPWRIKKSFESRWSPPSVASGFKALLLLGCLWPRVRADSCFFLTAHVTPFCSFLLHTNLQICVSLIKTFSSKTFKSLGILWNWYVHSNIENNSCASRSGWSCIVQVFLFLNVYLKEIALKVVAQLLYISCDPETILVHLGEEAELYAEVCF